MTPPRRHLFELLGLAGGSGLLLFLSDFPVHAWPLQTVALLPLLLGLERRCRGRGAAALAGLALGLCYTLPLLVVLEFPLLMGGPLALYQTLIWVLIALGMHWTLSWPSLWGPLGAAAVAVLVEWVDFTALPVWGTAQCFARVWTACPRAIQIVSLVGVTGLVFLLVATQALLLRVLLGPGRRAAALALAVLLGVTTAVDVVAWRRGPAGTLRVAAMGWTAGDLPRGDGSAVLETLIAPLARQAAARGARLVVTPEVSLWLGSGERRAVLERLGALARELGVTLAVGYFDRRAQENRLAFIDERGSLRGVYTKTHLIPLMETYRAGTGQLTTVPLAGFLLGGMICQDDNFTDLARGYGRRGVHLVAVPTNDWQQVKDHHLENSLFRGLENRYAVVRAASNGISAIVSSRGEVVARRDHFREGPGVIVAEVRLDRGPTGYSRAGDVAVLICGLLLLGGGLLHRRR